MTTDGFLVCLKHGDVFWQQGADESTEVHASTAAPAHPKAPTPVEYEKALCFCGSWLQPQVRPSVRLIPKET